ncbi:MAG: nitrilase [Bacteroides sp. SM23_62_1]|nr:MAG: nitrilase [Bacteroides sp. SM23_62_1]
MTDTFIATAQFEHRSRDKAYNISKIEELTAVAAKHHASVVSFHEMCITGYAFLRRSDEQEMLELAEPVPEGSSTELLIQIASRYQVALLAGLLEKDGTKFYNTYICVNHDGMVAKFRKLHPFINKYLSPGNEYVVFELFGNKCGILICYDNNVIENVRATTLLGAEIIFMPHVTGCTPSAMPGRDYVNPLLWANRFKDPDALRKEFDSRKYREWLLRWLPARAYDNGVYLIFSNPIGMDDDQVKGGGSMILDPFGDTLAECRSLGDEVIVADCTADKVDKASGKRYRNARRPELYRSIIGMAHHSEVKVEWMEEKKDML